MTLQHASAQKIASLPQDKFMEKLLEIKKTIKEKKFDRRILAKKIGIAPNYLNLMLNGWVPLKENYEKAIKEVLENTIVK